MASSDLVPGIQAYYRSASTDRLVRMLGIAKAALGTDEATPRTPTAIAFIESVLRDRGISNVALWNRDVCLRRIAERTDDRDAWQGMFDLIEAKPENERGDLYAQFLSVITAV